MSTELKKTVQVRHAALLAERDQFVIQANQKLGEYAGRLAELEGLLTNIAVLEKTLVSPDAEHKPQEP